MDKESWRSGGDSQPAPRGESSFDELAKNLADGSISRRKALRLLGGALVGAALASVPGATWAEKCKPLLHKCGFNTQCCSRNCIKNPQGQGRICGCPTSQTLCNNQCIVCNNAGEIVNPETCQCECPTGQVVCNNACVSNVCGEGEVFNPTTCQCEAVFEACPGNPLPEGACFNQAACGAGDQFCGCLPTTEASFFCIQHGQCGEPCLTTLDCPEGKACVFSCCGGELQAFCQFPCGVGEAAAAGAEAGRTTFGG